MYNGEDLLYTNTFITPINDTDAPSDKIEEFKNFYLAQNINNPSKDKDSYNKTITVRTSKPVTRLLSVDSRHRDTKLYPYQNDFEIVLPRTYHNIISIELVSSEFPNTAAVIKDKPIFLQNNKIYWINEDDVSLNYPVYSVNIRPGSYTAITLESEIESKMKNVKREDGFYHYFIVTLDLDTDQVTFTSLINTLLSNNPLSVNAGSGIITVKHPSHGYIDGQLIYFSGAKTMAGISAAALNSSYNISYISPDLYSYEVIERAVISLSSDKGGGGNSVNSGKLAPFKLLFGEYDGTVAKNIGFSLEDSSFLIPIVNPLTTTTLSIINVIIGDPVTIVSLNHGLKTGQKVNFQGLITLPSISLSSFVILSVPNNNTFTIDFNIDYVDPNSIPNAIIGTGIVNVNLPNHGFNTIMEITNGLTIDTVNITSLLDHNLNTGDSITITSSDSIPSIDGTYIITVIDFDTINIPFTGGISTDGTYAIIGNSLSFYLYGISSDIGGILHDVFNNIKMKVYSIVDENNFKFILDTFATSTMSGGGDNVRISSEKKGFRGTQTNISELTGNIVQPIHLNGSDYCFLVCPGLGGSIDNTGLVPDVLARMSLSQPPGALIFDGFTGIPQVFDEGYLPKLETIRFQVTEPLGNLYDFQNIDYSFTLKIVEMVDNVQNSGISTQRGLAINANYDIQIPDHKSKITQ